MGILPPSSSSRKGKRCWHRMLSVISTKPTRNGCSHMPSSATCVMPTRPWNFRGGPNATRCQGDRHCAGRTLPTIRIYCHLLYIQFNLHRQLFAATEHARANGVVLKATFPSASAATVWKPGQVPLLQPERPSRCTARRLLRERTELGPPTHNWDVMGRRLCLVDETFPTKWQNT